MGKKLSSNSGLSLPELLIAIFIFTFMIAALYGTLLVGQRSWKTNNAYLTAQRQTRLAMTQMTHDFHVAQALVINTQDADNIDIDFTHPTFGEISYTWSTSGDNPNQIIRQIESETPQILASNISTFTLSDTTDYVSLTLTSSVENAGNFNLTKKIAKR